MREYVPIFFDWLEVTEELNAQEKGRLIDTIVLYARGGDWQDQIKGNERYLFPAFRKQIDRANEISEVRSRATDNRRNQTISNDIKRDQNTSNDIKTSNNNYNKEDKENNNDKEKGERERRRFTPPTRDEVAAYISEKGYAVDADAWMAHYESNGWRVGSNPMKDWKAAVRTWARNDINRPRTAPARQVIAQQYTQRSYEGQEEINDALEWFKDDIEAAKEGTA